MKPDIVFFGEDLPVKFYDAMKTVNDCDLLIVMGTGLAVAPFCEIVDAVQKDCPKVLINLENTNKNGYNFQNKEIFPERLFL